MEVITAKDIAAKKAYEPAAGLRYELADGIVATMRKDTIGRVEEVEAVPVTDADGNPRSMIAVIQDRAKLILDVPSGWDDWKAATPRVVWRAVQDFLRLSLPVEIPQNES